MAQVWEESLISCPASARIVALSATASNSDQLRGWLENIHGPTDVVESDFRPVPLRYEYADAACGVRPLFRAADVRSRVYRFQSDEVECVGFVSTRRLERCRFRYIYIWLAA